MNRIIISEGDPCGVNYPIISKILPYLLEISQQNQVIHIRSQNQFTPQGFTEISHHSKLPEENGLYAIYHPILEGIENLRQGTPSCYSGKVSIESVKKAIQLQKKYPKSSLLTMPLSKEWVIKAGYKNFVGHTEFLADSYEKNTFMLMYGESLKVILLTNHIPLKSVSSHLEKIDILGLTNAIKQYSDSFKIENLKIGFLGLNPHSGEDGLIGNEEKVILKKLVNKLSHYFNVESFLSPDSAFTGSLKEKYDFFIACYHDQGLIPFKILEGKNGINLTLGLDFLRVSPDHGPAFDISSIQEIDETSVLNCLKLLQK